MIHTTFHKTDGSSAQTNAKHARMHLYEYGPRYIPGKLMNCITVGVGKSENGRDLYRSAGRISQSQLDNGPTSAQPNEGMTGLTLNSFGLVCATCPLANCFFRSVQTPFYVLHDICGSYMSYIGTPVFPFS